MDTTAINFKKEKKVRIIKDDSVGEIIASMVDFDSTLETISVCIFNRDDGSTPELCVGLRLNTGEMVFFTHTDFKPSTPEKLEVLKKFFRFITREHPEKVMIGYRPLDDKSDNETLVRKFFGREVNYGISLESLNGLFTKLDPGGLVDMGNIEKDMLPENLREFDKTVFLQAATNDEIDIFKRDKMYPFDK